MLSQEERNALLAEGEKICDLAVQLAAEGKETQALEQFDQAETVFCELREQRWLNFTLHEKFRFLQKSGRDDQALELADTIIEGYLLTENRHGLSLIFIHKADLLHKKGSGKDALANLNAARAIIDSEKLDGLKGYFHTSLASILMSMEHFSAAIDSWEKALELYSEQSTPEELAWCLQQAGLCCQSLYDYAAAERHYQSANRMFQKLGDVVNENVVLNLLRELKSKA